MLRAFLITLLLMPTLVRGDDLPSRIVAGLNTIWPNEVFEIGFDGCQMTFVQVSALKPTITSKEVWHLGDLDTDPENIELIAQTMTDGVKRWKNVQVIYRMKPAAVAKHAKDVARFEEAHEAILSRPEESTAWDWWWDPVAAQAKEDRIHSTLSRELRDQQLGGEFGHLIQRNYGHAVVGLEQDARFELSGFPMEPLGFLFQDDVLDGLLADLHAYAQNACAK